jgi:Zn-finger nucleic acid-binding protein
MPIDVTICQIAERIVGLCVGCAIRDGMRLGASIKPILVYGSDIRFRRKVKETQLGNVANTAAADNGHGLLCPTCRVDLVMSERQSIEIDYCPKCRGVWLDRGELDKIIERNASEEVRAAPAPQGQPYPPQGYNDRGHGSGHGGGHGRNRGHGSFLGRLFD